MIANVCFTLDQARVVSSQFDGAVRTQSSITIYEFKKHVSIQGLVKTVWQQTGS